MKKILLIVLISLISVAAFIIITFKSSSDNYQNMNEVKKINAWVPRRYSLIKNITAYTDNKKFLDEMFYKQKQEMELTYNSTIPGLYLTIDEIEDYDITMDISIYWGPAKKRISLGSHSFISWRPLHSGFLYISSNDQLNYVRFYLARKTLADISQVSYEDLELFAKSLESWFGGSPAVKESQDGVIYRFPWGFVKSGTYPDGILAKVIVGYKRF